MDFAPAESRVQAVPFPLDNATPSESLCGVYSLLNEYYNGGKADFGTTHRRNFFGNLVEGLTL
jgi:hypothetical protein